MMNDQMQKALNLARKTGDRLIVFSHAKSANPFVVMTLDEYEKIIVGRSDVRGLTEDELIDKINRDIAIWKSDQEEQAEPKSAASVSPAKGHGEMLDLPVIRPEEDFFHIGDIGNVKKKPRWLIPQERKAAAEEVIEEDRQYLEEVF